MINLNFLKLSKFFLFLTPFALILVNPATLFPFIVTKYTFFRLTISLSFVFLLLSIFFNQINLKEIKDLFKKPLVINVTLFTLFFLLACLFAYDSKFAFWSNFERGEGGLQILHLWLFFILLILLFKDHNSWVKFINFFIFVCVFNVVYGVFASLGFSGFIGDKVNKLSQIRLAGALGNPAYLATFLIYGIFFSFYIILINFKKDWIKFKKTFIYWFLILFLFLGFLLAATRGGFVGLFFSILVFIFYLIFLDKNKKRRKILFISSICLILLLFLGVYFRDSNFIKNLPGGRLFELDSKSETWVSRVNVWEIAFRAFLDRPILGWGPENFLYIYPLYYKKEIFNPEKGFNEWFDRAHSIYFDYLSETGILGLLSYLSIFIFIYFYLFKLIKKINFLQKHHKNKFIFFNYDKLIIGIFIALPISYLVQGIVLFDILPIYLSNFFMFAFFSYEISRYENILKKYE